MVKKNIDRGGYYPIFYLVTNQVFIAKIVTDGYPGNDGSSWMDTEQSPKMVDELNIYERTRLFFFQ